MSLCRLYLLMLLGLTFAVPALAQTLPLPLERLPNKTFADVQTQAKAESTGGPTWGNAPDPSTLPVHQTFTGTVTADATMTKLAIFSDDGSDVFVDGTKVWSSKDKPQALPDIGNSLHELPVTLSPGSHSVEIDYSNIIYTVADAAKGIPPDIDGCTLFMYGPAPAPFLLSASPATVSLPPGGTGSASVTVTGLSGFSGTVSLSASGQPSGVTATFSQSSVAATGTSALTFTASKTASPGSYPITIKGSYGTATLTTTLTLTITDFSLSAAPASLSLSPGSAKTTAISLTPLYGFTGSASLSVASSLPAGMTVGFAPTSVSAGSPSTLTLTTTSSVTQGTYNLIVSGLANGVSHTAPLTVTVANPFVSVTIGALSSPSLGQQNQNHVYVGVPCTATITASVSPLPGGYSASQLVATWSQYSYVYLFYSQTGEVGTWTVALDGSSVTPTLNGVTGSGTATSPAGTFNATFKQAGYYQVCIGTTVSFYNPTTNQTFGPYTGYGFATNSNSAGASASSALSGSPALKSTRSLQANSATPPAGTPAATGDVQVAAGQLFLRTLESPYVRLKSVHPSTLLFTAPIGITTVSAVPINAVVSCPGGQVGFSLTANPATDSSSLALPPIPVAPNGVQSMSPSFYVTGRVVSSKVNDVEIDLKDASTGVLYSKTMLTVFGFTKPQMNITAGSDGYQLFGASATKDTLWCYPITAAQFSAQADIAPTGVDVTVPPISRLKLGIIQNGVSRTDSDSHSLPQISWVQGRPSDGPVFVRVPVYESYALTPFTTLTNDAASPADEPFLRRSATKATDPVTGLVSIASPTTVCTDADDPSATIDKTYTTSVIDSAGNPQTITYTGPGVIINVSFADWCTIYDSTLPAGKQDEWLCESKWSINTALSSTATLGTQQSDTSSTEVPVETGTTCNALSAALVVPKIHTPSSATTTITYPNTTPTVQ